MGSTVKKKSDEQKIFLMLGKFRGSKTPDEYFELIDELRVFLKKQKIKILIGNKWPQKFITAINYNKSHVNLIKLIFEESFHYHITIMNKDAIADWDIPEEDQI